MKNRSSWFVWTAFCNLILITGIYERTIKVDGAVPPSINDDGTINWGMFDPIPKSNLELSFDDIKHPKVLSDMSQGFVDFVVHGLPYDTIRSVLIDLNDNGEIEDIGATTGELILGFIGVVILVLIGILLFFLVPFIGFCFCCCRCCGNCGGKREQVDSSLGCKRVTLSIIFVALLGILGAGMALTNTANDFQKDSLLKSDVALNTISDGVLNYTSDVLKFNMSQIETERSMWSDDEVFALLGIWCDASIMSKLDGTCRNAQVYRDICMRLGEKGYSRTVTQIKYKMKNLKKEYRKLMDHNNRSGRERRTIKFQDELSLILGDRPSANPVRVVEVGSAPIQETHSTEEEESDEEASTFTFVPNEEHTNDETDDSQVHDSPEGPSPPESPPPSEPAELEPGPSAPRRKRKASADPGQSNAKKGRGNKSMLVEFHKWQKQSDERYFHEENKWRREQREAEEKWRSESLAQEKKLVDSLTNFMTTMTSMVAAQRPPTPAATGWPTTVSMMNVRGPSQHGQPFSHHAQPTAFHYRRYANSSAFGYPNTPPPGPFAHPNYMPDETTGDQNAPGPSHDYQRSDPR